MYSTRNSFK